MQPKVPCSVVQYNVLSRSGPTFDVVQIQIQLEVTAEKCAGTVFVSDVSSEP